MDEVFELESLRQHIPCSHFSDSEYYLTKEFKYFNVTNDVFTNELGDALVLSPSTINNYVQPTYLVPVFEEYNLTKKVFFDMSSNEIRIQSNILDFFFYYASSDHNIYTNKIMKPGGIFVTTKSIPKDLWTSIYSSIHTKDLKSLLYEWKTYKPTTEKPPGWAYMRQVPVRKINNKFVHINTAGDKYIDYFINADNTQLFKKLVSPSEPDKYTSVNLLADVNKSNYIKWEVATILNLCERKFAKTHAEYSRMNIFSPYAYINNKEITMF